MNYNQARSEPTQEFSKTNPDFRHNFHMCLRYRGTLTRLSRVDLSTITLWTGPFPEYGVTGYFLLLSCFVEISEFNANNVDSDQTPRSAASDLGLHCLPMSLLWDARVKNLLLVQF